MSDDDFAGLPYRPCVGVMLVNAHGRVFVGKRIDNGSVGKQEGDAWQMPQGGIDDGESPRRALFREMLEEIGTDKAEIVAVSKRWLKYELSPALLGKAWRGKYRGQEQKWFLMRFTGRDSDINIATDHPEFSAWQWLTFARLPGVIVTFKRGLYLQIVEEFGPILFRMLQDEKAKSAQRKKAAAKKASLKKAVGKKIAAKKSGAEKGKAEEEIADVIFAYRAASCGRNARPRRSITHHNTRVPRRVQSPSGFNPAACANMWPAPRTCCSRKKLKTRLE